MEKYRDSRLPAEERAADLLARMTLEEKIAQLNITRGVEFATHPSALHGCSVEYDSDFDWNRVRAVFGAQGIGFIHDVYSCPAVLNKLQRYMVEETRLGIPCIFTGEALHGLSGIGTSVFPVPLALAATFSPDTVRQIGAAIAAEARSLGIHEILAPNLDLAREPRWGRVEETFGEDTCLSCRMAEAIITGEQKGDIGRDDAVACEPKHYCVHGIAEGGVNCAPARAGQREVESCHLPVFEAAVRAGACNAMASYNSIDGDVVMCSRHYLTAVLKERMGLPGYIRADWGGVRRLKEVHHLTRSDKTAIAMAKNAGLDMQGCCDYPEDFWADTLAALVREGTVSEMNIDDSVRRVLTIKFRLGLFEHPYTDESRFRQVIRCDEHKAASLQAARESITLLKNDGVLPLSKSLRSIALLGPSSAAQKIGGYSPTVAGYTVSSVYEELKKALGDTVQIRQCDACAITQSDGEIRTVDGQPHLTAALDGRIEDMVDTALEIAASCDAVVLVCGDNTSTSGEGMDVSDLRLHGRQRELICRAAALGKPTVLVLENGKPLDISEESACVGAVMAAWFGGEFGAKAIVEALLGDFSPAGRLPVSFPREGRRIPCYYSMLPGAGGAQYLEGERSALFGFGHGLSYTAFAYRDLQVEKRGGCTCRVSLCVKNTGGMAGDEVVQIYVRDVESSVAVPDKTLQAFRRIHLEVGEEQTLEFTLGFEAFRLYGLDNEWRVEPGEFEILAGASSRDIRLTAQVIL